MHAQYRAGLQKCPKFCCAFLSELQGPARAVVSCSISHLAGELSNSSSSKPSYTFAAPLCTWRQNSVPTYLQISDIVFDVKKGFLLGWSKSEDEQSSKENLHIFQLSMGSAKWVCHMFDGATHLLCMTTSARGAMYVCIWSLQSLGILFKWLSHSCKLVLLSTFLGTPAPPSADVICTYPPKSI